METIYDKFIYNMPLLVEKLSVNKIGVSELMRLRNYTIKENMEEMTCRPIISQTTHEALKSYNTLLNNDRVLILSVFFKEKLIGKITFSDYNLRNQSMELGYYMIPEYRNRGLMKRALTTTITKLFTDSNINKIYAQTGEFNILSCKILTSLGFHLDGILREHQ